MTITPADLLAAAKEVLSSHDPACDHIWNAHRQCQWCHRDRRDVYVDQLARHILATVHPDDDEPVTVEWLRSDCGFYGDDLITHKWITTNFRLYFVDKIARGVVMYTGGDTHYKTRGQVRILLKALNVEVK